MKIHKAILAAILYALGISPTYAADFNIKVPVRMYNMVQGVGKVKVTCEILDAQGQRVSMASKWSEHHVNYYTSGLEEDIVVAMDAYADKDPRIATKYRCDLKIQTPWVQEQPWQTPSQNANSMFLKAKPGTEFRVQTSGLLYSNRKHIPKAKIEHKPLRLLDR